MRYAVIVLVLGVFFVAGCATKVTRTGLDKVMDFSGLWNDTDARMVAQDIIDDCLKGRWLVEFNQTTTKTPVVIVGSIKNTSYEHIDSTVFTSALEKALINSGRVNFVANKEFRQEVRDERADQQAGNTNPETISPRGLETGADFMLQGAVTSVKDEVPGKYSIFYQVTLELIDMKTNRKVWIGQKEIKKLVQRPHVGV